MKTLAVYYSKTGNTKKVAEAVIKELGCDSAELVYDETAKTIGGGISPEGFDRVILLSPIWAFEPAEPMKLYLARHGKSIQNYSLLVTCKLFGLRTCILNCKKAIGKAPVKALKIKDADIRTGNFDITPIL